MMRFLGRAFIALLLLVVLLVGATAASWKLSPTLRERFYLVLLFTAPEPVQRWASEELRDYPTKTTAISLIFFINLNYSGPVPKPQPEDIDMEALGLQGRELRDPEIRDVLETELERMRAEWKLHELERQHQAKLAERAFFSLCILTGHDFGTYYEANSFSKSWGSLSDERWSTSLGELNRWSFEMFGDDAVNALEQILPEWFPELGAQ